MSARGGSAFGGKKVLILVPVILFVAAACNNPQPTTEQNGTKQGIVVVTPSGGESWMIGAGYEISWIRNDSTGGPVSIELISSDSSNRMYTLAHVAAKESRGSGKFIWTIGQDVIPGKYVIKVYVPTNCALNDPSCKQLLATSKEFTIVALGNKPNNQTADWKTYSNSQYGFEVKYPASWQVVNNQDVGANIADPKDPDKVRMSVFVYTSDPEPKTRDVDQITNSTLYNFQGINGKKLTGESGVTGKAVTMLIVKKGNVYYQIETPPEIFDAVLSTFKFTK